MRIGFYIEQERHEALSRAMSRARQTVRLAFPRAAALDG
jgi:hypothetical protein